MKSISNNSNIESLQDSLNRFDNTFDLEFETKMIMYRFLSEVEDLCDDNNLNRKMLANKLETSPSYITQLFRGNKILNLSLIAKIQKLFNVTFEIKAIENNLEKKYEGLCENSFTQQTRLMNGKFMIFSFPDAQTNNECVHDIKTVKRRILAA